MVLIYNGVTCRTDERVKREESPRPPRVMDYALKSYHLADFSPSSYSPPDLLRLLLPPSSSSQSSSMLIFWSASYLFCSRCKWDYIFVVAVGGRECVGWVFVCVRVCYLCFVVVVRQCEKSCIARWKNMLDYDVVLGVTIRTETGMTIIIIGVDSLSLTFL